jgi:hypothetical protein
MKHYYGAMEVEGGWIGVIYHYEPDGNTVRYDYRSINVYTSENEAINAAGEILDARGIEAELD